MLKKTLRDNLTPFLPSWQWGSPVKSFTQLQLWIANTRHILPVSPIINTAAASSFITDRIVYTPFMVDRELNITELWLVCTSNSWNSIIWIYDTFNERPLNLLCTTPNFSKTALQYYWFPVTITLQVGVVYWMAYIQSWWGIRAFSTNGYPFMPRQISWSTANQFTWFETIVSPWWTSLPATVWTLKLQNRWIPMIFYNV